MPRGGLPHAHLHLLGRHRGHRKRGDALAAGPLALAHGYDTAFWWIAGIFASGAIIGGAELRRGPLYRKDSQDRQAAGR